MPHISLKLKVTRSTRYLAPHTAKGEILCPDRIPQGERSFMMVLIDWSDSQRKTELIFHKPTSGGGDIRFDGPDGPTKKVLNGDTQELLVIYGQAPTAGSAPDVDLIVRDEDKERARVSMSVGPLTTGVQIRAQDGTAPAHIFMVPETSARFRAVAAPATPGSFRWAGVPSNTVQIRGSAENELVEVAASAPSGLVRPTGLDEAPALCALFTPTGGGPAVMAVHRIWPLTAPEEPGPFPVGTATYHDANHIIDPTRPPPDGSATLTEGITIPIEVSVEALVRYPAVRNGANEPFSAHRTNYPLVILAHGRHAAYEVSRNADGTRILNAAGQPIVILTPDGTRVAEFKNYEGLEYLASHLASYGFVAISINLNGRFTSPDTSHVTAELVAPAMDVVACRPFRADQVAIAHRGLTILRHIQAMTDRNRMDPLFRNRVDLNTIALIGQSRGGEAVVSAYNIRGRLPDNPIRAVLSIAPSDLRNMGMDAPYCVILGSDDLDTFDGSGLRLYDRARPPKQMIWVHGAIHNYFSSNWHRQDEGWAVEPAVSRPQHQNIAKGYSNVFLQRYVNGVAAASAYFTRDIRLASLASVELHQAYQTTGGLVVDQFEDVPADRTRNALNGGVTAPAVRSFDEVILYRFTDAAPFTLVAAHENDLVAGIRDLVGCMVNQRSWYHDTNGLIVEWDSAAARYTTSLPNISVAPPQPNSSDPRFDVLSFRVAQDVSVNPGGPQDFRVRLTDSAGQHATLRVGAFATIPFPRKAGLNIGTAATPRTVDLTKSVLKTVRLPLSKFKQSNPKLNLGSLASITFEFSEKAPGRLGFDDLEFSK